MGKKRQRLELQKTKLRVGKKLPKGQNVTNTTFKTKKITTKDQLKDTDGKLSLKDILNSMSRNCVSTKLQNIKKLYAYISENQESLPLFFPDTLKKIGNMLLESDAKVRDATMSLLYETLKLMTATQVNCIIHLLTTFVHVMLTHHNPRVKRSALTMIDLMKETHPQIITGSAKILKGLLNLISSTSQKGTKRQLNEHISRQTTSQDWRMDVISRIHAILNLILEKKYTSPSEYDEDDDEDKVVYWDGEKPLYLPLYLRGGLKPPPLEGFGDSESGFTKTEGFKIFVSELIPLLGDVVKGLLPRRNQNKGDNPFDSEVVEQLNIVVQILGSLGEWMLQERPFNANKDKELKGVINKIINDQLFKFFPCHPLQNMKSEKNSQTECMQLNLGACYLYCMFALNNSNTIVTRDAASSPSNEDKLINYIGDLFRICSGMCEKSISLMIKINKLCMNSPNVNDTYKNGFLIGLYGILDFYKLSESSWPLFCFFMDISMDYAFKHILESEAMQTWFSMVWKEITMITDADSNFVNKRFYKYVRHICARKYSYFVQLINKSDPAKLLDLLKFDNEELHLTVTQIIGCLEKPSVILEGLVDVLSEESFSLKSAIRIIRQLHSRFSGRDVHGSEKMHFLKFLLNLGCDTSSLIIPCNEAMESSDMLRSVLGICQYNLKPSTKWRRHLKITEVCWECLICYWNQQIYVDNAIYFLKSIMNDYHTMPIHCVIALLKLRRESYEFYEDNQLLAFYVELLLSSMMYLSVMLLDHSKNEALEPYAMDEVKKNLNLKESDGLDILNVVYNIIDGIGENEIYHVLRTVQFLIHQHILRFEDGSAFYPIYQQLRETCSHSHLLHPLFRNLQYYFQYMH